MNCVLFLAFPAELSACQVGDFVDSLMYLFKFAFGASERHRSDFSVYT